MLWDALGCFEGFSFDFAAACRWSEDSWKILLRDSLGFFGILEEFLNDFWANFVIFTVNYLIIRDSLGFFEILRALRDSWRILGWFLSFLGLINFAVRDSSRFFEILRLLRDSWRILEGFLGDFCHFWG